MEITYIPPIGIYLIMIVSLLLSSWLQEEVFPQLINACISFSFFFITILMCYSVGGPIAKDPTADILCYIGIFWVVHTLTPCREMCESMRSTIPSPFLIILRFVFVFLDGFRDDVVIGEEDDDDIHKQRTEEVPIAPAGPIISTLSITQPCPIILPGREE